MVAKPRFHERQFLGYNRFSLIRRMTVMLFCFLFYYVADEKDNTRDLFFYLGVILLVISAAAMLISHLDTRIEGSTLWLRGPMTFRKVTLDLVGIKRVQIQPYSRFLLNRPVFNLHRHDSIRFYTHGRWSVEFVTRKDELIRLGTQRPEELKRVLVEFVNAEQPH